MDTVGGHIPGAVNFFWKDLFNEGGSYKSTEELEKHFEGIDKEAEIFAYCGSGVSAPRTFWRWSKPGLKACVCRREAGAAGLRMATIRWRRGKKCKAVWSREVRGLFADLETEQEGLPFLKARYSIHYEASFVWFVFKKRLSPSIMSLAVNVGRSGRAKSLNTKCRSKRVALKHSLISEP
ncbi:sulfurtransferase [Saccharibacillus deserti]|uniref:sulfurtransferase n=1 Tax=Saccharibacillus deserti TaxID=1634444 RepID=UPI0031B568C6